MKKMMVTVAAGVALLASGAAQAKWEGTGSFEDRFQTPYVSGSFGWNWTQDADFNYATGVDVESEFESGYAIAGEVGYNMGPVGFIDNNKLGIELGFLRNDVNDHNSSALALNGSTGELNATTLMANMYHEYNTGTQFVPYYGVGIGMAEVEADGFGTNQTGLALDRDETGFMYQGTLGLNYIMTSNADFGVRYRYSAVEGIEFSGTGAGAREDDFEYDNHALSVVFAYNF